LYVASLLPPWQFFGKIEIGSNNKIKQIIKYV